MSNLDEKKIQDYFKDQTNIWINSAMAKAIEEYANSKLEEAQKLEKTIARYEQFDKDFDFQISENNRLKAKVDAVKKREIELTQCLQFVKDLRKKNVEQIEAALEKLDMWEWQYEDEANVKELKFILSQGEMKK